VRHLAELHGGEATAESEGEGKGATFRVRLPVMAVRVEAVEKEPVANGQSLAGVRVLVIDNEADARELLRLVLTGSGGEGGTAASAAEALHVLGQVRLDVMVSDLAMPGTDGYALIRQVRARPAAEGGEVPAVALTAYARAEDRAMATAAGFQTHASKPI